MTELTKEWLLKTIAELEEERDAVPGVVNEDASMALAAMKLALASLEAEPVAEVCEGFALRYIGHGPAPKSGVRVGDRLYTATPAPVAMKDHQIRELVNELRDIAVKYHGSQQLREHIARTIRAAMLQGAEQTNYRAIVERIAEIVHGKVTDIDLLTVTVKSIKDNLQGKASLRDEIRSEHAEWSQYTFGDVGPVGPLKHLSKEALEAAAEPEDLSEWADMQFMLWDAQRRAGITDEKITQALIDKLAVNKARQWPEPKDGEPRLHIKACLKLEGQEKQKK